MSGVWFRCRGFEVLLQGSRRHFGTDSPFVRWRRQYEKELHELRRKFREASEQESIQTELARKARAEASISRQRSEAAEHRRKLEMLKERIRREVEPVKPTANASPAVVIEPAKLEAYSEEFGFGYVMLARRAVEKELKRTDQGAALNRALREVRRERAIVRKHLETRVEQQKRVQLVQMLQTKSAEWITRDRVDVAVDAAVQEFFASGQDAADASQNGPGLPGATTSRQ
ncbi:hypothetical protein CCYA_CCYA02G0568 [Cyanidiococcus yangmingshanensis]|nr:hypothetical protein CCYA_CCYA02G0568 [Cyanidiococcus yangmingshanensis]